ncbi:MAG: KEOPS complex subunit Cgi121 [Nitrososphaerota archaeon]|nr:hypothetical protein [Candidatus Geocrenenecus dongiae]
MEISKFKDIFTAAGVYRNVSRESLRKLLETALKQSKDTDYMIIFRSDFLISLKQVHVAAVSSVLAFRSNKNIARNLAIEFMLRLSADTQINRVLEKVMVRDDLREIGVLIISSNLDRLQKLMVEVGSIVDGEEMHEEDLHLEERLRRAVEFYGLTDYMKSIQTRDLYESVLLSILEKITTIDVER